MHAGAFGFSLKKSNIKKLTNYANNKLSNIDFNENYYEADFVLSVKNKISSMIFDINSGKDLWGQGNPEPLIVVRNIPVRRADIQVCGAKTDTVRFSINGVTYIKFQTPNMGKKIENLSEQLYITVVGTVNVNEWNGTSTPQILIKDWEIKDEREFSF